MPTYMKLEGTHKPGQWCPRGCWVRDGAGGDSELSASSFHTPSSLPFHNGKPGFVTCKYDPLYSHGTTRFRVGVCPPNGGWEESSLPFWGNTHKWNLLVHSHLSVPLCASWLVHLMVPGHLCLCGQGSRSRRRDAENQGPGRPRWTDLPCWSAGESGWCLLSSPVSCEDSLPCSPPYRDTDGTLGVSALRWVWSPSSTFGSSPVITPRYRRRRWCLTSSHGLL